MAEAVDPIMATQAFGAETGGEGVLAAGTLVAHRYRIDALLGQGGMGSVYRAQDLELDEVVALKTLGGDGGGSDEAAIERFRREVKLARKVTHPNVARTFDLGATEGVRFITMELIEGVSLARRIEEGGVTLAEALRLCADIARGLVAAHSAGVVHRDLKPDNVLLSGVQPGSALSGQERVVITDFGIARAADDHGGADERPESQRSRPLTVGVIVGTPAYMAPEQIVGETPDGRSDVYALGVVLFEMLTGRLPFSGKSAVDIATARLTRAAPDVREANPDLPEPVAELVESMLARDRRSRPDASAVLSAIERLRGVEREGSGDPVAGLAKMPGSATMMLESATAAPRIRSVAVLPLTSSEPALGSLARELGATLADGLSRVRSLRVIPPALAGDDLPALSKGPRADVALAGSVRAEGERLRINLRCIDLGQGTQRWAERFEGSTATLFALEDALGRAAEGALRALSTGPGEATLVGPSDPTARALYERALESSHRMNDLPALEEALELARRAHDLVPADAAVMSLLGLVLVRVGVARRTADSSLIAEAEDWALRALNADAGSAHTFVTLGLVRLHQGDIRASVRAFREALARDPRHAEASAYLGRFLIESGFIDEGIKRLEFALRIEPSTQHAWWNLARSYALLSRWEKAEEVLDASAAATGNAFSPNVVRARIAFWRRDPAYAAATADRIEQSAPPGHFLRSFVPALRAYADGDKSIVHSEALRQSAENVPSLALRAFWFQVSAEIFAVIGRVDAALDAIDSAVALPFIDVGWMDHCPAFTVARGAGRFGQARAIVAARAAALWK